jgi:chaperonin cofactor prefoldin
MFAQSAPAAPEQEVSVTISQPVQEVVVSPESRTIKHLETLVETLQSHVAVLERYNNHLEEENEALKKANSSAYVARAKNA